MVLNPKRHKHSLVTAIVFIMLVLLCPETQAGSLDAFERCQQEIEPEKRLELEMLRAPGMEWNNNSPYTLYIILLSIGKKSIEWCNVLSDETAKAFCVDMFYVLSSASPDKDDCSKIKNENFKNFCLALKDNNPAYCLSENDSMVCNAVVSNDLNWCSFLEQQDAARCRTGVYLKNAVAKQDIYLCEKMENKFDSAMNEFRYRVCRILSEQGTEDSIRNILLSYKRNLCILDDVHSLINTKDKSFCEQIPWKNGDAKPLYGHCLNSH